MKLGIMQPYFFPNLGHFSLIAATDKWVVFDTPQFDRKGWMNRNRILKRNGGWKYIRVPTLKAPRETSIRDICLDSRVDSVASLLQNLDAYTDRGAQNQDAVEILIQKGMSGSASLVDLNVKCLSVVCEYLGIDFNYEVLSGMCLDLEPEQSAGTWAPNIARALGAQCYVNPIGGTGLFRPADFSRRGVKLAFLEPVGARYNQGRGHEFVDGLSVLDALMFLSPDEVRERVDSYRLHFS
jgi:hypothetical protein